MKKENIQLIYQLWLEGKYKDPQEFLASDRKYIWEDLYCVKSKKEKEI